VAEQAALGWRVFDAHGVLRCKRFPCDDRVVFPHGLPGDALWLRTLVDDRPDLLAG
jgi:hypothetical protein